MKKLLAIFCAIGIMASMAACGEKDETVTGENTSESVTLAESSEEDIEENSDEEGSKEDSEIESRDIPENGQLSFDGVDASKLTSAFPYGNINFNINPDWTVDKESKNTMIWKPSDDSSIMAKYMDISTMVENKEEVDGVLEHIGDGLISAGYEISNEEFITIQGLRTYHVQCNTEEEEEKISCNMFMFLSSDSNMIYSFTSRDKEGSTEAFDAMIEIFSTITM